MMNSPLYINSFNFSSHISILISFTLSFTPINEPDSSSMMHDIYLTVIFAFVIGPQHLAFALLFILNFELRKTVAFMKAEDLLDEAAE